MTKFGLFAACSSLFIIACGDGTINDPRGQQPGGDLVVGPATVNTLEDTSVELTLDVSNARGAVTVTANDGPTHGTFSAVGAVVTYVPSTDYNGDDAMTVSVSDGSRSVTGSVSITVTPVNDPPVAIADTLVIGHDTPYTLMTATVLANDSDVDSTALSVVAVTAGEHLTVTLSGSDIIITPAPRYTGATSFTYTVSDGENSARATVSVTVSPDKAPVAVADTLTTAEDTPLTIAPSTLLANDSDPDGDTLSIVAVGFATNGTVVLAGGSIIFTPALDFHGTATFSYAVSDGVITVNGAVTVTVTDVNDGPVVTNGSITTPEDTAVAFTLVASDPDGDALTYATTAPANGTLSGTAPHLTYTPSANFNGTDVVAFTVSDGGAPVAGTFTITVTPANDAPVADAQSLTIDEDTALGITLTGSDVDDDTLTFSILTQPAHGTLSGTPPALTYTPTANFHGGDSFGFAVNDGSATSSATVAITVSSVEDPPIANNQSVTTNEDVPLPIMLTATDGDGDTLTYAVTSSPTHGALTGTGSSLTYTPNTNYHGSDTLTFSVTDGKASATGTVAITVISVNDPPSTSDQRLIVDAERATTLTPVASDPDGDAVTYVIAVAPQHGQISGTPSAVIYTPDAGYTGADTFVFAVSDGTATSSGTTTLLVQDPLLQSTLSVADSHSCEVRADASLWCWGGNRDGQLGDGTTNARLSPHEVTPGQSYRAVAGATRHTCAVRSDRTLWCWGNSLAGQLGVEGVPQSLVPLQVGTDSDWASVSTYSLTNVALKTDGSLWCWGDGSSGQCTADAGPGIILTPFRVGSEVWSSATAGRQHACGIRDNGTLWCWGENPSGQLGDAGSAAPQPRQVGAAADWLSVSAGLQHSCGAHRDGLLECWGDNGNGAVGVVASANQLPVAPDPSNRYRGAIAALASSCATLWEGGTKCFGRNLSGSLGVGEQEATVLPTRVVGTESWIVASAGNYGGCARDAANTLACWGYNASEGWLGIGISAVTDVPRLADASSWSDVPAPSSNACGVKTDGSAWCWGPNTGDIFHPATGAASPIPVRIDESAWSTLASGTSHACGLHVDGTAWCWGTNTNGQLGTNAPAGAQPRTPQAVEGEWSALAVNGDSNCAIATDGTVWCWGANSSGKLGLGSTTARFDVPTAQNNGATRFASLSLGATHGCAIADDGGLWCWGANARGQVGDGTSTTRLSPVPVGTDRTWAAVSTGERFTCGIDSSAVLSCWGEGTGFRLGNNAEDDVDIPTEVGSDPWQSVSAGATTCGLQTDASLWCWGSSNQGTLGLAGATVIQTPTRVSDGWASVEVGSSQVLARTTDGRLWAWGNGTNGNFGDNSAWRDSPVTVH